MHYYAVIMFHMTMTTFLILGGGLGKDIFPREVESIWVVDFHFVFADQFLFLF